MKSSSTLLLFFYILIFSVSCKNTHDHEHGNTTSEVENSAEADIALNNGEKWEVNEEMKPFITTSQTLLNEFIIAKSTEYDALAAQLKEKNSALIKSCTMQGQSHDELHKWLHPHMELIESLANTSDVADRALIATQIQKSFETYSRYFQ